MVVRLVSFLGFTTVVGFATFPFDMAIFTWSGYAKYSYEALRVSVLEKVPRERSKRHVHLGAAREGSLQQSGPNYGRLKDEIRHNTSRTQ